MGSSTEIDRSSSTLLASFSRRNQETGAPEQVQIRTGEFNGKLVTSARVWYQAKPISPGDDGWRPSKIGVTIREHEIDQAIRALEEVRELIHAQGRSTGDSSGRTSHPVRQSAPGRGGSTTQGGPQKYRSHPDPKPKTPQGPAFDEFGADDDLAEYRRR